jgi:hypothetical protein
MWPRVTSGGHGLPRRVNDHLGLQMALGVDGSLVGSRVTMGVAGGLWGSQLTSGGYQADFGYDLRGQFCRGAVRSHEGLNNLKSD